MSYWKCVDVDVHEIEFGVCFGFEKKQEILATRAAVDKRSVSV